MCSKLYRSTFHLNQSRTVPKRDVALEEISVTRSHQLWTAQTSQMLSARTDCTGSQHVPNRLCSQLCSPQVAQPGVTLLTYYEHIGAVVSTGHERCCTQARDMYLTGTPRRCATTHPFEWRTTVFAHAPHPYMPPISKLAFAVTGVVCTCTCWQKLAGAQCWYI